MLTPNKLGSNIGALFMTSSVSFNDSSSDEILYPVFYNYDPVTGNIDNDIPTIRPMLSLKNNIEIQSGNGTIDNPYTLK